MIKQDILNIDCFTNRKGKNYRKAKTLNINEIDKYFSKKKYEVIDLRQIWRHVHGKLKKGNKFFFLKMASTSDIGERTRNEVLWNQQIDSQIKKAKIAFFGVPHIYETGVFKGKFYFLSSYYDSALLASKNPLDTKNLARWLDKIVKTNLFFLSLRKKDLNLKRDFNSIKTTREWNDFFHRVQSWYQEVKEHRLKKIFETVKDLKENFELGINHGDFVPWHIIREKKRFILIDGEHASAQSPKYYDACYFYHRLYTTGQNPELAKYYFSKLRSQLLDEEKNKFDLLIRPILASRIIGGFWDAKTDGQTDITYHLKLRKDFLNNNLTS